MRCTRVSDGCRECWHLKTADRLCKNPGLPENERNALAGKESFVLRERELSEPLRIKKPSIIGVQFMGDLFHENVPYEFIQKAYEIMQTCNKHTFLILTKRANRMAKIVPEVIINLHRSNLPLDNVWHGLTVCNQQEADEKMPLLLKSWPGKKWISIEPMLGPIKLWDHNIDECPIYYDGCNCRDGIDAVVLGGETGTEARPIHPDWVRFVRDQCRDSAIPFFFKGWGKRIPCVKNLMESGANEYFRSVFHTTFEGQRKSRLLDGREHNDLPWRVNENPTQQ